MNLHRKKRVAQEDRRFISLAESERVNSEDPKALIVRSSGVGAVIVKDNQIVSISANVLPAGLGQQIKAKGIQISEADRYHFIEHAERAAIYKALLNGVDISSATMYCTRFPCSDCARAIIWTGISRLVVEAGPSKDGRWLEAQNAAEKMLREAGVVVELMNEPDTN